MSEFHFGAGAGMIRARAAMQIDRIARRHGATFTNTSVPGNGWRYWFAATNRGEPFNSAVAKAVFDDLLAAGLATEGQALSDTVQYKACP